MNLMFSYPIKRQKILASQMLAVWLFNFAALVLTKLAVYLCIFAGSKCMPSSFFIDFNIGDLSFYLQLILKSGVIVSMSFIALFIGMIKKSSKTTIVTSFLLMAGNALFPVVLTALSFLFAFLSIYNAERKDLL